MKVIRFFAMLSIAGALLGACGGSPTAQSPTTAPAEPTSAPAAETVAPIAEATAAPAAETAAAAAGETAVEIGDNTYTPKEISVAAGTTVVWTNNGQLPHTVTADDGAFDSKNLDAGAVFRHTFDTAGTFAYYCQYHGSKGGVGMAGVVKVGD